ncbi:MAG: DUF2191 domain-containing protein [Alphaproteobacteria bacterium]|nr:DUF2191 domain-containing protein [Alphaproteobacteria bacterium]
MATIKTTIEISDPLLRQARKLAEREGVTLRTIVERGLNRVVSEARAGEPFRLRRASVKGDGLQPGVAEGTWAQVREMIYEGRGG